MIEFAIILPILILLVCAIIDFGWLFYNQFALSNGAREGARFAAVNSTKTDVSTLTTNKVLAVVPASVKPGLIVQVVWSNTADHKSGDVTVTLKTNVRILTPVLGVFSENQQKQITSKVTMKAES